MQAGLGFLRSWDLDVPARGLSTLPYNDYGIEKLNAFNRGDLVSLVSSALQIVLVHFIDLVLHELDRGTWPSKTALKPMPIGGLSILDDVQTSITQQRKKDLEAGALMRGHVRAIVQNEVNAAHFVDHSLEEASTCLRANSYLGKFSIEFGAFRVDVDAEDDGPISESLAPESQRAAFRNSNFKHSDA